MDTATTAKGRIEHLTGVPEGMDALVLGRIALAEAARSDAAPLMIHIARDDRRLEALAAGIAFFTPKVKTLPFPAWDTVPYDRIGPQPDITARRITTLSRLALQTSRKDPTILLTTVNAILQRVPPRAFMRNALKPIAPGQRVDLNRLVQRLAQGGFTRTGTVMEPGEFAVRGGIVDVFPPGRLQPVRLDFFGDTLETIKSFDPETQRSDKIVQKLVLMPMSEAAFGEEAEKRFRAGYVAQFGAVTGEDPLYAAISAGQRYPGLEHWLPLFHDSMETVIDYAGESTLSFDHQTDIAVHERFDQIKEHYQARIDGLETTKFGAAPYKPLPPDKLFLAEREWQAAIASRVVRQISPFEQVETAGTVTSFKGKTGRNLSAEKQPEGTSVFDALRGHILRLQSENKRVLVNCWTPGARERLTTLIRDHGIEAGKLRKIETLADAEAIPRDCVALGVLGMEHGFEAPDLAVIGEQDILGDRMIRPRRKARKAADVITEATSLSVGDLVVHADHGIGRFDGLKTITALGACTTALSSLTPAATSSTSRSRTSSFCRATARTRPEHNSTSSAAARGNRARRSSSSACSISPPNSSRSRRCGRCAKPRQWHRLRAPTTNSSRASHTRKPKISSPASKPSSPTSMPASRWIASYAATSASERLKWPCVPHWSPPSPASRSPSSCRPPCSRASTTAPS